MGFFDSLKKQAESSLKSAANSAASNTIHNAVNSVSMGSNKSETFTFASLPTSVEALASLPEASLDSPFKTAALALVALMHYENDPEVCFAMLDAIRGPEPMTPYAKSFIKERLNGKTYVVKSFFGGATVENGYTPTQPFTVTVSENPYSYPESNWATLFVKSAGADSPRPIKLRKKPSTNQWFLNDIQCLSEIRKPAEADPWA